MKLYDRIMSSREMQAHAEMYLRHSENGFAALRDADGDMDPKYRRWMDMAGAMAASMPKAVVIDASNVAAYVSRHGFSEASVPSMMPPYPVSWWETSKITPFLAPSGWDQIGVLVDVFSHDRVFEEEGVGLVREIEHDIEMKMFAYDRSSRTDDFLVVGQWEMTLDKHGRVYRADNGNPEIYGKGFSYQGADEGYGYIDWLLMAIGFTHCKNVEIVSAAPPPYKVRRKQELKLGRPLTEFKELVIDPNATQKRTETGYRQARSGSTKSLHIARGHFAHYTEDKPLFGKYTGTFWRPAHVRGSADAGIVYKDYKVKV